MSKKNYDIVLFGVTGFTGKLCAEYILSLQQDVKWAACARNQSKAEAVLSDIAEACGGKPTPPLLIANLVCETEEQEETLRQVVRQSKVVLTCSGPFEKYGKTLVKLCAELGVHYADITGETDFFRSMIHQYDKKARESGAAILCHCGGDCIPQDITVYEMHVYAQQRGAELRQVTTYSEFAESARFSGGTLATAVFQLSKDRPKEKRFGFDSLLQTETGTKSDYVTKNISPKNTIDVPELESKAGPWIMGPVMVNCVRRSNALLHYAKEFKYGDAQLKNPSLAGWLQEKSATLSIGAVLLAPSIFGSFLPHPGQGPDRSAMEAGHMTLYGHGIMVDAENQETELVSKFFFGKDIAYLYTAALLVETGLALLQKNNDMNGGVMTPAVALGSDLTQRILKHLDASFEIKEA